MAPGAAGSGKEMTSLFEKHLGLAFAAALTVLAAVGAVSYRSTRGLIEAQTLVNHTQEVIDRLDELVARAAQAESATRGYVLSGDSLYVDSFRSAFSRIEAVFGDLRRLNLANGQREALSSLKSALDEKLAAQARMIDTRKTAGHDAASAAFLTGRGYILMGRIRDLAGSMKDKERNLLLERTDRARRESERSTWGLLAGSLLSFAVLLAVYYQLTREVGRRKASEERLVRSNRLYAVLSQVNQTIVRVRDRGAIFEALCRIAIEHGHFRFAWLGTPAPGGRSLKAEAVAGRSGESPEWIQTVQEMPAGGQRIVCNDLADGTCRLPWRAEAQACGYGSAALFPILVGGVPAAVFILCASEAGAFDDENLALLDEVVSDVGFALEAAERDEQRKKAETALRLQAQIVEQVHDSIISTDLSGYITSWNKGAERMTGFDAEEAMGKHISILYSKGDQEFLEHQMIAPLMNRGNHEVVARMRRKSGQEIMAHVSLSLLRDERGEPIGMIGYSMDITESRRAEQALRESEERFRQMAENIHEVFWMADTESARLLYVSPAYETIWGRSCESAYAQPLSAALDFVYPADRETAAGAQQALLAHQEYDREFRVVRPNGSVRWVWDRAFPVRDHAGGVYRFAGIARDITERKEAALALQALVAQQRAVAELGQRALENTGLDTLLAATVRRVAEVLNVECCKVLELMPGGESLLLRAGVGWREGAVGTVRVNAERGSQAGYTLISSTPVIVTDFRAETRFRKPDLLSEHGILSGISVVIGDPRRPFGVLGAHSTNARLFGEDDVHFLQAVAGLVAATIRRAHAEEEILRLNRDLEIRVEERTAELARLNLELAARNREVERANRLKSEFLATMSHELRTPLNSVIGFTELLVRQKPGPLTDKQERFLKHIDEAARHLLQLINDILDLSRIEAGRIELSREHIDIGESLVEVLSVIKPLAGLKHLELATGVPPGFVIYADRIRFKQMLYNLLSNAVKFTPEGGRVRVECVAEEPGIRLTVADTGIGIPLEEQNAIFDQFHQVGVTARGVREGAGLGLAITRRLVELHGGRIWVESQPGHGSRFTFTLPGVGGGEKGYQFSGREGARCGVTLWPAVGRRNEGSS